MSEQEVLPPVEIPMEAVSPEALQGIIENFILREGTDYGAQEATHETKVRQIQKQLERGESKIAYDPNTDSVSILTKHDWLLKAKPRS